MKGLITTIALLLLTTTALAQDPTPASTGSPTIHGNVFGGGRMADVSNKATQTVADANKVTATIDIYASTIIGGVFGGNDITGAVVQATGDGNASAKITIHDKCDGTCTAQEVYGGGNGYYKYKIGDTTIEIGTITDANKTTAVAANTLVTVLDADGNKVAEFYTTAATTYGGLLPALGNTSLIVGEATDAKNHVALAEVYGGAKNAYVTGTSSVTVNSGTIGKVFAGNNYGGNAQSAILTINGTKKPATEPTKDNFASFDWSKVGDYNDTENGFGIGEAYGGGNAVDVNSRALVYMNDGYVGTLFGGNNLADMSAVPSVHLNGGNLQTVYGGGNAGAMKGCIPGAIDVSQYLDNTLFLAYDELPAFKNKYNGGTKDFSTFCSNDSYLYFYGAETLIEQKDDNTPLRIGTVYGGCRSADVLLSTYVRMTKADYMGNIYGGCDISGSVAKGGLATGTAWVEAAKTYVTAAEMNIEYFDIENNNPHAVLKTLPANFPIINLASMVTMTGGTTSGNIFAGGNGDYTYTEDGDKVNVYHVGAEQTEVNLLATIDKTDYYRPWVANAVAALEGGELLGNLYGGGNDATVGLPAIGETPAVEGRSYVFLGKTARGANNPTAGIQSAIYAGGKKSDVYGTVDVIVKAGCDLNALYAGNDISGQVEGTNRKNFLSDANPLYTPLYGGGTTYSGESLTAPHGDTNSMVQTYVRVEGANAAKGIPAAKIKKLFGGGNGDYDYTTEGSPYYGLTKPTQHSCWLDIKGYVETSYGGGNAAEVGISTTYITGNAQVGTAFAGGNAATVTEAANLIVDCNPALYKEGSNTTSDHGFIIDETLATPALVNTKYNVGTLFGGNNIADMAIVPNVQLFHGKIGKAYGGGNQGSMTGVDGFLLGLNTYLNDSWLTSWDGLKQTIDGKESGFQMSRFPVFISTNLTFDAAKVDQSTLPEGYKAGTGLRVDEVYGGCKAANVDNSSYIRISAADYVGDIYGGCDVAGAVGVGPMNITDTYTAPRNLKCKVYDNETEKDVYAEDWTFPTEPKTGRNYTVKEGTVMRYISTYVTVTAGTIQGKIYGGGNGAYDYTSTEYSAYANNKPWVAGANVILEGGTFNDNIYLGGNAATVGKDYTGESNKPTYYGQALPGDGNYLAMPSHLLIGRSVRTTNASITINEDVYCGGRMADVFASVDALVKKDVQINNFYAGNDISGQVNGSRSVYRGEGSPYPNGTDLMGDGMTDQSTTYHNDIQITDATKVNLTASTYVRIEPKANIGTLFGGGNGAYNYSEGDYKGLQKPYQESSYLDVAGFVTTAYGGGNAADIGTSNLWIMKNAQVGTAFAGGNSATVRDNAQIFVECNPALYVSDSNTTSEHGYIIDETLETPAPVNSKYNVGTLFGGNNIANMAIVPNIQLFHGKIGTVYGGGNQGNMTGVQGFLLGFNTYLNDHLLTSWSKVGKGWNESKADGFQMSRFPVFISTNVTFDAKAATTNVSGYTTGNGLRVDKTYGGCKAANVNNSTYIRVSAADYVGDVYGGCDIAGGVGVGPLGNTSGANYTATKDLRCWVYDNATDHDVYADTWQFPSDATGVRKHYTVEEGTVMRYVSTYVTFTGGEIRGKVYGGGNGAYDYTSADYSEYATNKPWVVGANVIVEGGTFHDNIYLGGNAATVGKDYSAESTKPYFYGQAVTDYLSMPSHLLIGKTVRTTNASIDIKKDVYCGGRMADVYSTVDALVKKEVKINSMFAGNDISGSVSGRGRDTRTAASPYPAGTDLIGEDMPDATKTYYASTGLSSADSHVYVRIEPNAEIGTLFGGGNGDYNYALSGNNATLEVDGQTMTFNAHLNNETDIKYVKPYQESSWLDIRGKIGTVYGGGNAANNNRTAVYVMGEAQVGSSASPGAVYGGCKSADVIYRARTLVAPFKDKDDKVTAPKVWGNVFAGCDISGNVGDCTKTCLDAESHLDKAVHFKVDEISETWADQVDYARVSLYGGTITGRIFGGGNGLQSANGTAYYTANAEAANNGLTMVGTAPNESYQYPAGSTYAGKTLPQVANSWVAVRGTEGQQAIVGIGTGSNNHTVFGGGQGTGTRVIHNVEVELGNTTENTLVNGTTYGGSYAGFVNTSCEDITRTTLLGYGNNTQIQGDVYGGSYGNYVRGSIELNIANTSIGVDDNDAGIYAGNNNAGQPECSACINYVGNDCNVSLFGGGNHADFYGTTRITFTKGSVGYIYGGGNHAPVYGNTIVEVLGGHVCHDVFGGGNEGGVFVNKQDAEHPYGGNTLVIVRDDCLQLGADSAGKNPGDDGYVATFKEDAITGNYSANRDGSKFYSTFFNGNDPYADDKGLYILMPNASGKKSTIEIEGNVFGGGNAADVEGKATVIIGNKQ